MRNNFRPIFWQYFGIYFSSWKVTSGYVVKEGGIAVFREIPGDDLEGRGKEDLGQLLICY